MDIAGETLLTIEGMDFPDMLTVDLSEYSAIQLFVQSARGAVSPVSNFAPSTSTP
ncbi:MAG: hypothetical protein HND48_16780 [Chloroflexi bacterium]|nr:hypothetical protein [Chloroflexota bacterium]